MVRPALVEVPIVASALPEDLRAFLVEALPDNEQAAVDGFGFERHRDETPGLANHGYLEGYFHALPGRLGETALSVHPRFPFDRHYRLERRAAPLPIAAFCEALRRRNADGLARLAMDLAGPRLNPLRSALERGAHFADVSVQYHWGEAVPPRHAAWHRDACYSALHLAVGLQGTRTLLAQRQLQQGANQADERLPQRQGDVYLSAPVYFAHAVEFPAASWEKRTISMQCRFLLEPEVINTVEQELQRNHDAFVTVLRYLAACSLVVPTLEDVQTVVAELLGPQPPSCLSTPRDLTSTTASQDGSVLGLAQVAECGGKQPPSGLSTPRGLASTTASQDGLAQELVQASFPEDRALIISALKEDGAALQYEDEAVRADFDAVLVAVTQHGPALRFASAELRAAPEIVLAAMRQDVSLLQHASGRLLADRAFARTAVGLNGRALQHLALGLRADRELVLAAVVQDSLMLRFAASRLRADKKVVMAAVKQRGLALRYANEELRADPAVVLLAAQQDVKLARYASGELKALVELLVASPAPSAAGGRSACGGTSRRRRGRFSQHLDVAGDLDALPVQPSSSSRAPRDHGAPGGSGSSEGEAARPSPALQPSEPQRSAAEPAKRLAVAADAWNRREFGHPRGMASAAASEADAAAAQGGAGGADAVLPPPPPPVGTVGNCYLVGTWDDFKERHELERDGQAYRLRVGLAPGRTEESFQLLLGWWDKRLYPSIADASPQRPHEVFGPDGNERAHGKNWTLRRDSRAGSGVQLFFDIVVTVSERGEFSVGWESVA